VNTKKNTKYVLVEEKISLKIILDSSTNNGSSTTMPSGNYNRNMFMIRESSVYFLDVSATTNSTCMFLFLFFFIKYFCFVYFSAATTTICK